MCFMIFSFALILTACGNSEANFANNLSSNLYKLNNTIKNMRVISDGEIIVPDLISEHSLQAVKRLLPNEKGTTSEQLKEVSGNAFVIPNYNRNTDSFGNGFYGVNNSFYGYGNGFYGNNMYGGFGYGYTPYGYYANGNGYVGSNIDTYRQNIYNTNGNNYIKNRYVNNYADYGYPNNNLPNNFKQPRFIKNINTYKEVATNVNTYKNANNSYESRYVDDYILDDNLQKHYQKLTDLCSIQYDVVSCNDYCQDLKTRIMANISYLTSISEQIKNDTITLNEKQIKSMNDLLVNANNYANKINVARNDINDEIKSVNSLKENYSANVEQLSSKYIRLLNILDTRNAHLQNILSSLMQVENCLYDFNINNTGNTIIDNDASDHCEDNNYTVNPKDCEDCLENSSVQRDTIECENSDDCQNENCEENNNENTDGIIDITYNRKVYENNEEKVNEKINKKYIIKDGKIIENMYGNASDENQLEKSSSHITKNPNKTENIEKLQEKIAGKEIANNA